MSFYVYVLFRPDGAPCYIGKGSGNRLHHHDKMPNCHPNAHLARIIKRAGGKLPKAIIRDGMTEAEALALESSIIRSIGRRDLGHGPLVNYTDGGDGMSGWVPSQETREKIRRANTGHKPTAEQLVKMSKASKGRKKSPAHAQNIAAGLKGRPKSEEHRANLRIASALRWARSEEHAKIANWHATMSPAAKRARAEKISITTRAAMTEEARAKISAARRQRLPCPI